jgi:Uma2 family endonuclease
MVPTAPMQSRMMAHARQRAFYIEAGIPEYWIVDGEARSIRVITSSGDRIETEAIRWSPPGAPEHLSIDIQEFFSKALG